MKVFLMGSEGSMGKRYQAILKFLKVDFYPYDIKKDINFPERMNHFTHFIIATPTESHLKNIRDVKGLMTPILCEKPLVKNKTDLRRLFPPEKFDLDMMFQYKELAPREPPLCLGWGKDPYRSSYDYFRTGNDGLLWDCLQIIGIHQGPIENLKINNDSPTWSCSLNNKKIDFVKIVIAYIKYVKNWLDGFRLGKDFIVSLHEKVFEYKDYLDALSGDRNSGQVNQ